jgi:hypothetical protein
MYSFLHTGHVQYTGDLVSWQSISTIYHILVIILTCCTCWNRTVLNEQMNKSKWFALLHDCFASSTLLEQDWLELSTYSCLVVAMVACLVVAMVGCHHSDMLYLLEQDCLEHSTYSSSPVR